MARVYLDICCFNRPFDDQSHLRIRLEAEAKLSIQEKIRRQKIELAWSYMMDFENAANPYLERSLSIKSWRIIATVDTESSEEIITRATNLNQLGFKKKDSLHLACAISMNCDFFFTTDDGILKRQEHLNEIVILNPVDYVTRYDD
jgi:predicted nucleic acid-binding protein